MTSRTADVVPAAAGPARPGRLVGLDVARCLALLGMVATHVLLDFTPEGDLSFSQWLAGGRASALFAVLAGVSLALMTGGREPARGRDRVRASAGLAVRSLLIAGLGLALAEPDSGLAIILTYYGVLFLLGLPFVGLRARTLALLAAGWVVLAPVVSHLVRPDLPVRGFASPAVDQLGDPGRLASELLFTGYYPAVPWLAYLLAGMALGRCDLRNRRLLLALAGGGLALAVLATQVSRAVTDPAVSDQYARGMFGTTPADGDWSWLLLVAPHSATPFDLAQTIGSALLVIAVCLLIERALPDAGVTFLAVLFGAGTMTLTLYSLHVVLRTPEVWPPDDPRAYGWHVLVLLAIGAAFVARGRRGPLEYVVGLPVRALRPADLRNA
ncbi:heparan-alpha-glucosaminide N-acetyltransferase domain-containing protein [Nocardioides bizhenqiangii]|uniref:Heparan-alpha-glucosaminide N-acetyltransferase domain-containing protein n=1 Tax=Nocardioides bizhenqiangii TaxID=3095076 RepID=A0ABZ0ZYG6_9ACTN|nr:heparan-alpha-glucosaminide N-acetyltransferase domain-containing protein [Nocardioides sp. HM61]WQQ28577.1 heparan-alpha-glucosaminide N-acetyltransferase domain-containing protein [Nocardioides sp. HM61]